MYFLIRDTLRFLVSRQVPFSIHSLGRPLDLSEVLDLDFELSEETRQEEISRLKNFLERGHLGEVKVEEEASRESVSLVFDPLYVGPELESQTVLVFVHDLTTITRPDWHRPEVSDSYFRAFSLLYRKNVEILAVSQSTARDLWANLGIPGKRIRVLPLYDRFSLGRDRERHPEKRILFVGSLESRKNVLGLMEAFRRSGLFRQGFTLQIVGGDGQGGAEIRERARKIDGVFLRGRLSDEELDEEYRRCAFLAYPSFWEGFGLPALEALVRGIPLVLSRSGALPEVGGTFAVYIDPCDVLSIEHGLIEASQFYLDWTEDSDRLKKVAAWTRIFQKDRFFETLSSCLESAGGRKAKKDGANMTDFGSGQ